MAIVGAPIANGDGSYTFQQDTGDPLVLRGDAAERAFAASKGAPDSATASVPPPDVSAPNATPAPSPQEADLYRYKNQGAPDVDARRAAGLPPLPQETTNNLASGLRAVGHAVLPAYVDATAPAPAGPQAPLPSGPAGTSGGPSEGKPVFYQPPSQAAPMGGLTKASQTTSSSTSYTTPYSKTELAAQGKSDAEVKAGAKGQADVASEKGRQEADLYRGNIADLEASQGRQQALEAERRQVMDQRMAKLEQLSREAAAEKIDPNHFWNDKPASFKFESALFAGLGSLGEGLGGGKNQAMAMLTDSIDRDMKSQDANLKNKRDTIAAETNILGQLRQEYGDRAAADSAFRVAKLGVAQEKLREIGARNIPEEQRANLVAFNAKIDADRLAEVQKLNRRQMSSSTTTQLVAGGTGPGAKGQELIVPDGKGGYTQARSAEEARDIRSSYSEIQGGLSAMGRMQELAKSASPANALVPWTTETEREWNANREAILHAVNNAMTGKSQVVREQTVQRFEHALADKPWSPNAQAALRELSGLLRTHYDETIQSQLPGGKAPPALGGAVPSSFQPAGQ